MEIIAFNTVVSVLLVLFGFRLARYYRKAEELKKVRLHNEVTWKKKA